MATARPLLGHPDVAKTMIDTPALKLGDVAVRSPIDAMDLR